MNALPGCCIVCPTKNRQTYLLVWRFEIVTLMRSQFRQPQKPDQGSSDGGANGEEFDQSQKLSSTGIVTDE